MLAFFLFIVLPVFLFLAIVYVLQNRKKIKSRPRQKKGKIRLPDSPLQTKFLNMLGGDTAAAKRLIDNEKRLNPGHHDDWYWEKAIWRLERDRH